MQSKATTVDAYLKSLPNDRREAIDAVRAVILKNLDKGFQETMQYGMITYCVPHTLYPPGYHCNPAQALPFASLASQKNHMAVYLMSVYGIGDSEQRFRDQWAKSGKKLDMGKSCVRFKKLEDVALEAIGDAINYLSAAEYIKAYEAILEKNGTKHPGKPKAGLGDSGAHAKLTGKAGGSSKTKKSPAKSGSSRPKPTSKKAPSKKRSATAAKSK